MSVSRALLFPVIACSLAVTGCPTERMGHPKDAPVVEDEWSRIPPSKEWLYATGEFNGPHKAECDHVLGWIKGEESCKASLCEHGRDLGEEWLTRCSSLEADNVVEEARRVKAALTARATEPPTECGKRLEDMVRDGCGDGVACINAGQHWATRCAKSEGTPLLLRILQRVIERRQEQGADPVKLDPRTCDELRADVAEAGKCKDRFVCQEAIPRVDTYRDRCESAAERPTIATAVNELTVLVGGGRPHESILTRAGAPALSPADVPVALGDGSGGIIFVCDDRASDLNRYVASRKTCQGGKMVVARAFPTPNGVEVRVGGLDFPDDASFSARYPTIVATGEVELRDRELGSALGFELEKAAEQGKSATGAVESARLLTKAVTTYALFIKRSPAARELFTKRDDLLTPALKEIAKAKLAAGKGFKVPPADAAGLFTRARTRAFADLTDGGAVVIGAPGRAFTLDTVQLLPRAMEVYLGVLKAARPRKVDAKAAAAEKARGLAAAQACGASEKKLQDIKKALVSCNFGLEACDDAKHAALAKSVDEARLAAESAFHELETARTDDDEDADTIRRAAETAACREPWW